MSLCSLVRIFHANSSMPTMILMAREMRSHHTAKSRKCWPRSTSTHHALRWQSPMYDRTTLKILTKPSHTLELNFRRYLPPPWSTGDPIARSTPLEMTAMFDRAWKMHLPTAQMAPIDPCLLWGGRHRCPPVLHRSRNVQPRTPGSSLRVRTMSRTPPTGTQQQSWRRLGTRMRWWPDADVDAPAMSMLFDVVILLANLPMTKAPCHHHLPLGLQYLPQLPPSPQTQTVAMFPPPDPGMAPVLAPGHMASDSFSNPSHLIIPNRPSAPKLFHPYLPTNGAPQQITSPTTFARSPFPP